jgi:hypothetical protein
MKTNNTCRACGSLAIVSKALVNRPYVHADFIGDYSGYDIRRAHRGQTVSQSARHSSLVSCFKCPNCGRSWK